jgi:hypothetical protein
LGFWKTLGKKNTLTTENRMGAAHSCLTGTSCSTSEKAHQNKCPGISRTGAFRPIPEESMVVAADLLDRIDAASRSGGEKQAQNLAASAPNRQPSTGRCLR